MVNPNNSETIKKLINENKLLLEQLHIVQEKLEKIDKIDKNFEDNKNYLYSKENNVKISEQINDILSENIKLNAIVIQMKFALEVEKTNSLTSRLGNILIVGVSSIGKLIKLPYNLCKTWNILNKKNPPKSLGNNYQRVIDMYKIGGMEAVEKLLNTTFISSIMRANAYTHLARYLMTSNKQKVAELARLAWETDPRNYRLKWLAFRLHESGDYITSEALLEMLPNDISLTESEKAHIKRIRNNSINKRRQEACKILSTLTNEVGEQIENTISLKNSLANLKDKNNQLTALLENQNKKYNIDINKLSFKYQDQLKLLENKQLKIKKLEEENKNIKIKLENYRIKYRRLSIHTALLLKKFLDNFEEKIDAFPDLIDTIFEKNIK